MRDPTAEANFAPTPVGGPAPTTAASSSSTSSSAAPTTAQGGLATPIAAPTPPSAPAAPTPVVAPPPVAPAAAAAPAVATSAAGPSALTAPSGPAPVTVLAQAPLAQAPAQAQMVVTPARPVSRGAAALARPPSPRAPARVHPADTAVASIDPTGTRPRTIQMMEIMSTTIGQSVCNNLTVSEEAYDGSEVQRIMTEE